MYGLCMDSFTFCRMTEEATSGNQWAPDSPTLKSISRAAFELEDYWRIVEILHKRYFYFLTPPIYFLSNGFICHIN
jgi:hypothetical protein